jgi:hypothetical protein
MTMLTTTDLAGMTAEDHRRHLEEIVAALPEVAEVATAGTAGGEHRDRAGELRARRAELDRDRAAHQAAAADAIAGGDTARAQKEMAAARAIEAEIRDVDALLEHIRLEAIPGTAAAALAAKRRADEAIRAATGPYIERLRREAYRRLLELIELDQVIADTMSTLYRKHGTGRGAPAKILPKRIARDPVALRIMKNDIRRYLADADDTTTEAGE